MKKGLRLAACGGDIVLPILDTLQKRRRSWATAAAPAPWGREAAVCNPPSKPAAYPPDSVSQRDLSTNRRPAEALSAFYSADREERLLDAMRLAVL